MQIIEYKYEYGTIHNDEKYISIDGINREDYATQQFIDRIQLDVCVDKPTAVLFVDGFTLRHSETRTDKRNRFNLQMEIGSSDVAVKKGSSYAMHKWISTFNGKDNIVYANIVSNTCASGLYALYEAERLLYEGVCDEVIIIGEERTSRDTIRLFRELMVDITCGDGFVYMKLGKDVDTVGTASIYDTQWKYAYNNNPFMFTTESINTIKPKYSVDWVKVHGTGTKSNTEAEKEIASIGKIIEYKDKIGHTQGISSLLEMCIVLDDNNIHGKVLVVANGFGGFIGACTLIK